MSSTSCTSPMSQHVIHSTSSLLSLAESSDLGKKASPAAMVTVEIKPFTWLETQCQ